MHFANALVWEIIGPAMAGPTGPCATPMHTPRFFRIGTHFLLMLVSNNNNHQLQPLGLNSFAVFCVLFDLISIIDANIQKSAL